MKYLIIIIIYIISMNFLCQPSECKGYNATVIDTLNASTDVNNLVACVCYDCCELYGGSWEYLPVIVGKTEWRIPFSNISSIEFNWNSTNSPTIYVRTAAGTLAGNNSKIKGDWIFSGKTAFGDFRLKVGDTKRIIFKSTATIAPETGNNGLGGIEPVMLIPSLNVNVTSNLIGAWIWIDNENTSQRVPADIYIEKQGEHNVSLIRKDISIIQKVQINESLSSIEFNLKNDKTDLSLTYNKNDTRIL
jgi:hypothetical protein